ncbi:MAG TPA: hypothetical protein VF092_29650 [Longimicrobium sp.]
MSDRFQNFLDAGWLQPSPASDDEVADIWANALSTYHDAATAQLTPKNRTILGYDAGRLAAYAIVRARDVKIRAGNHHEITIKGAAALSEKELAGALYVLDDLRARRHALEYGWGAATSTDASTALLATVRRILELGADHLRNQRPSLASRIDSPE